jgi:nitrite reductase/ring-hydroxylating ferredoxin subunit
MAGNACGYRSRLRVPAASTVSRRSEGVLMTESARIPADQVPPGAVRRAGRWAIGNDRGELFAVSRRCRHQLADLSKGSIDADGCLVGPWHQSSYNVRTGKMVRGPQGFLGYHGPAPGYSALVRAYTRLLRLRIRQVVRRGSELIVE